MRWQDKLNKKDKKHLRAQGINTLGQLKEMRRLQREMTQGKREACWHCWDIAHTLGIEKTETAQ